MTKITPIINYSDRFSQFRLNNENSPNSNSFNSKENNNDQDIEMLGKEKTYTDPLNKWPVRGLAYSNELGAAISEIAPTLGILLWFPAMLYFGADIYDKYKNDKTSFDPNAMRGTSQAIFQLLASVILPTGAVIAGQKLASSAGIIRKNGLTIQTEEEVSKFSIGFMERRKLKKYQNNHELYKNEFFTSLNNQMAEHTRETKLKSPLKILINLIRFKRSPKSMAITKSKLIKNYAEVNIDRMFDYREKLMNNEKPSGFSNSMFKTFQKLKNKYAKDPEYASSNVEFATKEILKKFEQSRIFKAKLLKTIGGFISLGLAIKPIDSFVENIIMKKYVEPNLAILENNKLENNNK